MNYLVNISKLNNKYFALRHGQSEANIQNLIVSAPISGINHFGLTELGKKQVENSIKNCKFLNENTIIYVSDFKRTKQTAKIVQKMLGCGKVHFTKKLRERYFGDWEKCSSVNCKKVWKIDKKNPGHKKYNVESVGEVQKRTLFLICELEKKHKNKKILLISHGDTLQILETCFLKKRGSEHRNIKHLNVAEIKKLQLSK